MVVQLDLHGGPAIVLDMHRLTAVPLHARHGQAADVGAVQRLEDVAQALGSKDSNDQLHGFWRPRDE